jgi:hypothetical protein
MSRAETDQPWTLHEISVANFIFGEVRFLALPLAAGWRWGRGPSLPEVDSTVTAGNRVWVASGRAWYALRDAERRLGCELAIDVRPGARPGGWGRWSRGLATERRTLNGHPADVARGVTRRGLLRPLELRLLRAQLVCEQTGRTIRIEFAGNPSQEAMEEILAGLAHLRCH